MGRGATTQRRSAARGPRRSRRSRRRCGRRRAPRARPAAARSPTSQTILHKQNCVKFYQILANFSQFCASDVAFFAFFEIYKKNHLLANKFCRISACLLCITVPSLSTKIKCSTPAHLMPCIRNRVLFMSLK